MNNPHWNAKQEEAGLWHEGIKRVTKGFRNHKGGEGCMSSLGMFSAPC